MKSICSAGFRKGGEPEIKLSTFVGSQKKQEHYRKTPTSDLLTMQKPLTVCITKTVENLQRWEYQTILPAFREICMQVKKQYVELNMEEQTGSKLGKEYIKAVYCHLAYLTYMQRTLCEMPNWMKHKLESRFLGEISLASDMQKTSLSWQKLKRN